MKREKEAERVKLFESGVRQGSEQEEDLIGEVKSRQLLDPKAIQSTLHTAFVGQRLLTLDEVTSTQHIAQQEAREGCPSGTVILAEAQTQGKGRLGRTWQSPKGTGIWLSLIVRPNLPLTQVPQLTLLTAVALVRGISQVTGIEASIKWPNDVLIQGKKIAGILTELQTEGNKVQYVIIGLGLNVNQQQSDFPQDLAEIATSLRAVKGEVLDRTKLIASILIQWEELFSLYEAKGFTFIKTLWETYALALGETIVARTLQGSITGRALGITDDGTLLLEDAHGNVHQIYSADIET